MSVYIGYLFLYYAGALAAAAVASHHLYYNVMTFNECANSSPWRYPIGLQPFIIPCVVVWPIGLLVYVTFKAANRSMHSVFDENFALPYVVLTVITAITMIAVLFE